MAMLIFSRKINMDGHADFYMTKIDKDGHADLNLKFNMDGHADYFFKKNTWMAMLIFC